jgi:hypothetical protein
MKKVYLFPQILATKYKAKFDNRDLVESKVRHWTLIMI